MSEKHTLMEKALKLRHRLGEDDKSPVDIFRLVLNNQNITLIHYPFSDNVSGICVKKTQDTIIALNSKMSYGRQRFTLAHELYHMYYDDANIEIVCGKTIGSGIDIEKDADMFASYFLIPPTLFLGEIENINKNRKILVSDVVKLEQFFGVSRYAMLFRLLEEEVITREDFNSMKSNVILSATSLGYNDELYKPTPEEKQYMTYGKYISLARDLYDKELVSKGKYEELLIEAFRSDIVFNLGSEGEELFD